MKEKKLARLPEPIKRKQVTQRRGHYGWYTKSRFWHGGNAFGFGKRIAAKTFTFWRREAHGNWNTTTVLIKKSKAGNNTI